MMSLIKYLAVIILFIISAIFHIKFTAEYRGCVAFGSEWIIYIIIAVGIVLWIEKDCYIKSKNER